LPVVVGKLTAELRFPRAFYSIYNEAILTAIRARDSIQKIRLETVRLRLPSSVDAADPLWKFKELIEGQRGDECIYRADRVPHLPAISL
jgi:hypothetical protein